MNILSPLLRKYDKQGKMSVNPLGLATRLKREAQTMADTGCDAVLWPPLTYTQSGAGPTADGYGRTRALDYGQHVGRPLRWGSATQILEANLAMWKAGMTVGDDWVTGQYVGGDNQYYQEYGGNGRFDPTLFPKFPNCFVNSRGWGNLASRETPPSFGDMVAMDNALPLDYMLKGEVQAGMHRSRVFGLTFHRLDNVKAMSLRTARSLANAVPGFCFGEYWAGTDEILWWTRETGIAALDFPYKYAAKAACESSNLAGWANAGVWATDPAHAVPFTESADTDKPDNDSRTKFNKNWSHFKQCTIPAVANVIYGGDYYTYNLAPYIHKCWWVSKYALGAIEYSWVANDLLVWRRDGRGGGFGNVDGGMLCGINSNPVAARGVWVRMPEANTHYHDYMGQTDDVWSNSDGYAYVVFPPNSYGSATNGVCLIRTGLGGVVQRASIYPRNRGSFFDFSSITVRPK